MIKKRVILFYLVLLLVLFGVDRAMALESSEVLADHSLLNLSGSINTQHKIQMVLTREGGTLAGSYVYVKVGKPLQLKGTINAERNIVLHESDDKGTQTGVFKGTMNQDGKLVGTWSTPDDSKTMPFTVEPYNMDGCYAHGFSVKIFDGKDWVANDVENQLIVQKDGVNKLKFSLSTVGTNAHSCSVEGIATRVGETYEYRPEDCATCLLKILVKPDRMVIADPDNNCGSQCGYCGARAVLNSEFLFSEKAKNPQDCLQSYEGELFKGSKIQ